MCISASHFPCMLFQRPTGSYKHAKTLSLWKIGNPSKVPGSTSPFSMHTKIRINQIILWHHACSFVWGLPTGGLCLGSGLLWPWVQLPHLQLMTMVPDLIPMIRSRRGPKIHQNRAVNLCHTCDSSPSTHLHQTHIRANYIIWVWLDVNPWQTTSRMEWFPLVETIWFPVHVYK